MPLKYTDEQGRAGEGKEGETFTVEQAIEKVGFGWLQLRIYVISKMVVVSNVDVISKMVVMCNVDVISKMVVVVMLTSSVRWWWWVMLTSSVRWW